MIFMSYYFIMFAVCSITTYHVAPKGTVRLALVIMSSALFQAYFAGQAGVMPIFVLAIGTYFAGRAASPTILIGMIVINISTLIFYKYVTFIAYNALSIVGMAGLYQQVKVDISLPIPLGISFFVFEFVHYLYDRLKGHPPLTAPLQFLSFALFWPSLVAGPIKRYRDFIPNLLDGINRANQRDIKIGILRVGGGLIKKIIADNLTEFTNFWSGEQAFHDATTPLRWGVLLAITLRIYLDFSGYSDMAIGYARMMGIRLPENFYWPYIARSLTDFWHRWHISLSTWIRDYVYLPLGGSRCSSGRRVFNIGVAFALCGLWHGAAWNYVVWGLYHGAGLAICSTYPRINCAATRVISWTMARIPCIAWAITMLYVSFGWLLFFYPLPVAWSMAVLLFMYH